MKMAEPIKFEKIVNALHYHLTGDTDPAENTYKLEMLKLDNAETFTSLAKSFVYSKKCEDTYKSLISKINDYIKNFNDDASYSNERPGATACGASETVHLNDSPALAGKCKNSLEEKRQRLFNFVDPDWYVNRYPDVAQAGIDPVLHFENYGKNEGRHANNLSELRGGVLEFFDPEWYLIRYPDIAEAKVDPIEHYLKYGYAEKRHPSALASRNHTEMGEKFLRSIILIYERLDLTQPDYFIYKTWSEFFRLGMTRKEISSVLRYSAKNVSKT
jgi:hypothetical protein